MERNNGTHGAGQRLVKAVLAIMALGMLATGFILYMFAETLGLATSTAEIIAIAFLAAGVMDYLLLVMWDRIFASKQPPPPRPVAAAGECCQYIEIKVKISAEMTNIL